MNITRYNNPFIEIEEIREQFNRLLNNMNILNDSVQEDIDFVPTVNTREAEDAYYIEVDLPAVKKEDISIDVDSNSLTISGQRKVKDELKGANFYKIESPYGKFKRSFELPEDADLDNIEAKSQNGVLFIKIPKVIKVEKKPRKIEIK